MNLREFWSRRPLNQRLAVVALALGAAAIFLNPYRGNSVTMDLKELATVIDEEKDHVLPTDLAAWIVEGRSDYRLVDLRSERDYDEYHIPTAENLVLSSLMDEAVPPTERIVLYSDGGIHASQAWMLMRAKGFLNVYTLRGGLDQWKDDVLFPTLAENAPPQDRARFERMAALSRFFGGSPQLGGAADTAMALREMPSVEAPSMPKGPAKAKAKKKKEGC